MAERVDRWLDLPLSVLALVMIGLLVLDLSGVLPAYWEGRVQLGETAIWIVFAAAFFVQLAIAPDRLAYVRAHWLTAVSVVLPPLRGLRVLRALRLLRGVSLVRVLTVTNRGARALEHVVSRGQAGYVASLALLVALAGAAAVLYFERDANGATIRSVGDALWWAFTLMTTMNVGLEPLSVEGRIVGVLLRLFALGLAGYVTALLAAFLVKRSRVAGRPADHQIRALRADIAALRAEVAELRRPASRERDTEGRT